MTNEDISFLTKTRLSKALKKEMHRKPFSKITVSDIIGDCNVNRNTFYYHFHDIHALLKWTLDQEALNVVKSMNPLTDIEDVVRFVLDYIDQNKYIINCAYDSLGRDHLKRFFYADMKSIIDANLRELEKESSLPMGGNELELLSMFFTEGIAGLLIQYVTNSKNWSREEIIKVTEHLFTRFKIFVTE